MIEQRLTDTRLLALTRDLESQRDSKEALKGELESASSEPDRDMAVVQAKLSMALTDVNKWCERAGKYKWEVDNLQPSLQQMSDRWQKTAVIQAE